MSLVAALLGLVFFLIIVGVIYWGVQSIVAVMPIAEPFKTIINVVLVVVGVVIAIFVCIWLLGLAGIPIHMPSLK